MHRAESAATLAGELAALLAAHPPADPFTPEIVAVPAKGVERWLNQQLARVLGAVAADGVAANISFPSPERLVTGTIATVTGTAATDDPWAPARLPWLLLEVMDAALAGPQPPWARVLAGHLREGRADRRYATAAHFAQLFTSYSAERPAMLRDWAAGADTDGAGAKLDEAVAWQAQLWRELRAVIGVPAPAEQLPQVCAALRAGVAGLPARVSLFGPTRLGAAQGAVLDAFAVAHDVHIWLPHPSPELWQALQSTARPATPGRRRLDESVQMARHPLLASLGRDIRELQLRLDPAQDIYYRAPESATTLLAAVQADLAANRVPRTGHRADGSITVHACHGAARQVEVLRDSLMRAFAADPQLQPRDVLVMCPDIETYAPLIRAVFGHAESAHPAGQLRVRLADRALTQTNPLLAALATVLELARGRVTASEVLDLAAAEPVRARCRFSDDDIERLREWTAAAGARWGLDSRERVAHGLTGFPQNTFRTALDRILLGAAAEDTGSAWLGLTLPLDDVESNDIDLAGRFAEFIDRLAVTLQDLTGPKPAGEWSAVLERTLTLLMDVPRAREWQLAQAKYELSQATQHAGNVPLELPDVRALLERQLAGRPTRTNFCTGDLTVAAMVPMRSVPHRVIALLGLDDDVFPRAGRDPGDDILARDPLVAERDTRSADRQLLLDAIRAAQTRLILLYTGADPVTGAVRHPAVPLAELLAVLSTAVGASGMAALVTRHPLHPFDPRNFHSPAPLSYDTAALAGALALQRVPRPVPPLLTAPLPPLAPGDTELTDLVDFLEQPARGFLRQRLRLRIPDSGEAPSDELPTDMRGLPEWDIGNRLLQHLLRGGEPGQFWDAEWRRGTLPPFGLGKVVRDKVDGLAGRLYQAAAPVHAGTPQVHDVAVDLGDGRSLTGTIPGIYAHPRAETTEFVLAGVTFSRLGPKHRIGAWVRLLALAAQWPERAWQAVTLGRGQFGRPAWCSTLVPPAPPGAARAVLRALVELRDAGLCEPLPIAAGAAAVYSERRAAGSSETEALDAAAKEFGGTFGDQADRHLRFAFGPVLTFAGLLQFRDPAGLPRFPALAAAIWAPLLAAETLGPPA